MKRGCGTGAYLVRRRDGSGGTEQKPPVSARMSVRRRSHGERYEAERKQAQINTGVVQRGYEENLSSHEWSGGAGCAERLCHLHSWKR